MTLVFVIAALIGGLSHLTWLMVSNSPALAGGLLAAVLALGFYLANVSRRYRNIAHRRPIDQLYDDFQTRNQPAQTHHEVAAVPEEIPGTAATDADPDELSAEAETPEPGPVPEERP